MLTLTSKRALGTDGGDHGKPNPRGLISIVKKLDVILNFVARMLQKNTLKIKQVKTLFWLPSRHYILSLEQICMFILLIIIETMDRPDNDYFNSQIAGNNKSEVCTNTNNL